MSKILGEVIRNDDPARLWKYLEKLSPNTPIDGDPPIYLAALFGCEKAARVLVEAGADVKRTSDGGDTPLMAAARGGYVRIVQLLLEHKADIHACNVKTFNALIETFFSAKSRAHMEIIELLLDKGADPNFATSKHPVLFSALCDSPLQGLVTCLVKHGANPNLIESHWEATPLHIAIHLGNVRAVAELLKCGADPRLKAPAGNAAWSGLTPGTTCASDRGSYNSLRLKGNESSARRHKAKRSLQHACQLQ